MATDWETPWSSCSRLYSHFRRIKTLARSFERVHWVTWVIWFLAMRTKCGHVVARSPSQMMDQWQTRSLRKAAPYSAWSVSEDASLCHDEWTSSTRLLSSASLFHTPAPLLADEDFHQRLFQMLLPHWWCSRGMDTMTSCVGSEENNPQINESWE